MQDAFEILKPENNNEADGIFQNIKKIQECDKPKLQFKRRVIIDFWNNRLINARSLLKLLAGIYSFSKHDEAIIIHDEFAHNYFHWLTECLPKLYLYCKTRNRCIVILPEDYRPIGFVASSLEMLQWPFSYVPRKSMGYFKTISIPTLTCGSGRQHPDYFLPLVADLKKKFSAEHSKSKFSKIFITRRNMSSRRSFPYGELESLMKTYGYDVVEPERLSLAEQVELFSNCTHFVAVHGAGLTNIMFMPLGSKVMEIRRSDDFHNYSYYLLANLCRIHYYYFLAAPLDKEKKMLADDFVLDMPAFKKELLVFNQATILEAIKKC